MTCLAAGRITPPARLPLHQRLERVFSGLSEIVESAGPEEMAVESVFFAKNAKSALALGHVRGVALLTAARAGLPVFAYSPAEIKKAVVGYGRAAKEQVGHMVANLLNLDYNLAADVTDALACAVCHLNTSATLARLNSAES